MKRFIAVLLTVCLLCACGSSGSKSSHKKEYNRIEEIPIAYSDDSPDTVLEENTEEIPEDNQTDGAIVPYEYKNHLYYVVNDPISWTTANKACADREGHLVVITDEEEQNFVMSIIENEPQNNYWIGLYRDPSETEWNWRWVTNEEVTYIHWATGEPSNGHDHDEFYVHITAKSLNENNYLGTWNDLNNEADPLNDYRFSSYFALNYLGYVMEVEKGALVDEKPLLYMIQYEGIEEAEEIESLERNYFSGYMNYKYVLPKLTKPGYNFVGWYEGDEKVKIITNKDSGNKILTAVWTPIE